MNNNLKPVSLMRAAVVASALALSLPAQAQESSDPIKLTLHDWTGQLITTQLMGSVLKEAGYNVEYVQAYYLAQFAGLVALPADVFFRQVVSKWVHNLT